ncbi:MAG TPA: hypothetical protein ENL27_00250, partial [Candidatus Parcubacteria bacterium]|nr:hypothetical protein [Candidatus Parcubacteria bacterium]
MEKMDPIKTAEKVRADLNDEFEKDLEEAMGSEEASDKQEAMSGEQELSREEKRKEILKKMEARGEGKWANDDREKKKQKKTEEIDEAGDL